MPKPIHTKIIRSFPYQDFVTCDDEGSFPLVSRVPKCRNAEMSKPIHTKLIRSFASQDFATCDDEGSSPLVSWVPKRRNADERVRILRDFQDVAKSTLLPMQRLRSTGNRAPIDLSEGSWVNYP
jgi:hypothetical protein